MAQQNRSAESSTASSAKHQATASGSTDPPKQSEGHQNRHQEASWRRHDLQQQCLRPSGISNSASLESRVAAWLDLLGISQDEIAAHIKASSKEVPKAQQEEVSSVSNLVKESLSSPIPLDKDGWQVAGRDILEVDGLRDGASNGTSSKSAFARDDDGWKVVKSKKTKRRKGADTESTASPPESPSLGDSTQTSAMTSGTTSSTYTPAMSPETNTNAASPKPEGLGLEESSQQAKSKPISDQERYPNLSARDIEQVAKDVERSFIGPAFKYLFIPKSTSSVADNDNDNTFLSSEKLFRRKQLSHLVLTTLSKHPALHYFQGYHDILSVVLLTLAPQHPSPLPSELERNPSTLFADATQQALIELVAERISLHVIRDSMTRDLLPIMGQLKLLGNLVRLCDPILAELVDRASPLPFFALPWLLTLLTHDAGEVGVMQRVLEFVMAFGPSSAVYLCAAVLLERKDEVLGMDPDELEDPAMLHTILGRLPAITADSVNEGEEKEQDDSQEPGNQPKAAPKEANRDAMYVDPDVDLPSLASDRALVAATTAKDASSTAKRRKKKGVPISSLLQKGANLMSQYPLQSADMGADKIMGPSSVLFTWWRIFDPPVDDLDDQKTSSNYTVDIKKEQGGQPASSSHSIDWETHNTMAERALTGPTDAIVCDPHPPPPTPPASDTDEKHPHSHPHHHHLGKRRGGKADWEQQAKMLAVVGISGLLVAALIGASQNPGNAASSAATLVRETTSEETKRVLTLIVSLLSNWGRVVGSG